LLKGTSLVTVQKTLGLDRPRATAVDHNFTNTHVQEEFERKW
jgi:hypothetical protein